MAPANCIMGGFCYNSLNMAEKHYYEEDSFVTGCGNLPMMQFAAAILANCIMGSLCDNSHNMAEKHYYEENSIVTGWDNLPMMQFVAAILAIYDTCIL